MPHLPERLFVALILLGFGMPGAQRQHHCIEGVCECQRQVILLLLAVLHSKQALRPWAQY